MDVAHILLGHPWLYNLSVSHRGKENTYTFRYLNKSITLNPYQPKELLSLLSPKPILTLSSLLSVSTLPKGTIFLLHRRPFVRLGNSTKFYLTILATELVLNSISFPSSPLSVLPSMEIPTEIYGLLNKFVDIVLDDLPLGIYNMPLT